MNIKTLKHFLQFKIINHVKINFRAIFAAFYGAKNKGNGK